MKTKLLLLVTLCYTAIALSQNTYVPDNNFEQYLIDQGHDDVLDDYVLTANINTITQVNINNKGISDLTGIEDFNALFLFNCENNLLTSVDLSQNINLFSLRLNYNLITGTLDLSQNTALYSIECYQNSISTLILPLTTSLLELSCKNNQLTSLDVTQYTALTSLSCNSNQITNLDLSQNTNLINAFLNINQLTSLVLPNTSSLENLFVGDNLLTELDASQNNGLIHFGCDSNPPLASLNINNNNNSGIVGFSASANPSLTCIQVDNVMYSTNNWTSIDSQSYFSEDCNNLSVNEFEQDTVKVFPNPVAKFLYFKLQDNIEYNILDIKGTVLLKGSSSVQQNSIDLSRFPSGLYFIKTISPRGSSTQKIIKE